MTCSVVQLSTVHHRKDTRIFYRQVRTVAQAKKWSVVLMVADGKGSGATHVPSGDSIHVQDVGKPHGGRLGRVVIGTSRVLRHVRRLGPQLVHFHDPELIPAGIILKLLGYKVVYDVHEDVPRQLLYKYWIPRVLRPAAMWLMELVEAIGARTFDAIVSATPKIAERFPKSKTFVVQNFPIPEELQTSERSPYRSRENAFVYVGGIEEVRGAREMVHAMGLLNDVVPARLDLAGRYTPHELERQLQRDRGWPHVRYHGWAARPLVAKLLGQARAGLVVLQPTENYADGYPVKMFEYMAAGLPVIASDFPLWRRIVEDAGCGLLVDPRDPKVIAAAMRWILEHPVEACEMGQRGLQAVNRVYNWRRESEKLIALYEHLAPAR